MSKRVKSDLSTIAEKEKAKREAELVIANAEKAKCPDELVIARDKEQKAKREMKYYISYSYNHINKHKRFYIVFVFVLVLFFYDCRKPELQPENTAVTKGPNDLIQQENIHYVSTLGNDANTGTKLSPWLTLAYACVHTTTPGDTIRVVTGTYNEVAQCNLVPGVSIVGDGVLTVIKAAYNSNPLFSLCSSQEGVDGRQSISYLNINGNSRTGDVAIRVAGRKNVKVHDCTIIDFNSYGVKFEGRVDGSDGAPTVYATGNEFSNNLLSNCSKYDGYGRGGLNIGGQDGMQIMNNNMSQVGRPKGTNGYVIKYSNMGYLKGVKIYGNTITKEPYDGSTYDFAIEIWGVVGGLEICNNTIIGNTDLNDVSKGAYSYSVDFHHNVVGPTVLNTAHNETGVEIEPLLSDCSDVIIRNNYFKNLHYGFYCYNHPNNKNAHNVYIYDNIFDGMCMTGFDAQDGTSHIDNFNIWNNTAVSKGALWGMILPGCCTSTHFSVRNNIVVGYTSGPINTYMGQPGSTIDIVSIENNCFYNNGNNNDPNWNGWGNNGVLPTNMTIKNNLKVNPMFMSTTNFRLQDASPVVGKGIKIDVITKDYAGNNWFNPPSIGAYIH